MSGAQGESLPGLTLYPPWPWAITHAGKRLENRDWVSGDTKDFRLRRGDHVALHSGSLRSFDDRALKEFLDLQRQGLGEMRAPVPAKSGFVTGAVVAVVRYWGATKKAPLPTSSQDLWWAGCRYGWIFDQVYVLPTPVPCRGYKMLWPLPEDVLERVCEGWGKSCEVWTQQEGWTEDDAGTIRKGPDAVEGTSCNFAS